MPFQKGNRVNPGGRPQRKDWADMLRIVGNQKGPDGKRKLRLLAEKVYELALAGDMEAVKEIGNRRDGRPKAEADEVATGQPHAKQSPNAPLASMRSPPPGPLLTFPTIACPPS